MYWMGFGWLLSVVFCFVYELVVFFMGFNWFLVMFAQLAECWRSKVCPREDSSLMAMIGLSWVNLPLPQGSS